MNENLCKIIYKATNLLNNKIYVGKTTEKIRLSLTGRKASEETRKKQSITGI